MPCCLTIQWFSSDTNGWTITAASSEWFRLASVSPMSCTSAHATYSSSRPSRCARVAVCRQCVRRSTAYPPRVVGEEFQVAEDPVRQTLHEVDRVPGDDGVVLGRGIHHAREGGFRPVDGDHASSIAHPGPR